MKQLIILIFFITSLSACQLQNILPTSTAKKGGTSNVTLTKKAIVISPLNRKKVRQRKHGISITMEPIHSVPELWYEAKLTKGLSLLSVNGQDTYTETLIPYYKNSTQLAFRVKISNGSKRVFRPKNAVLTFNIDDESASVDSGRYRDLANVIIVPNASKTITVYGPDVGFLQKAKGTVHLGMYDVATGNKLSNYEWFFRYKTKTNNEEGQIKKSTVKLTKQNAARRNGQTFKAK